MGGEVSEKRAVGWGVACFSGSGVACFSGSGRFGFRKGRGSSGALRAPRAGAAPESSPSCVSEAAFLERPREQERASRPAAPRRPPGAKVGGHRRHPAASWGRRRGAEPLRRSKQPVWPADLAMMAHVEAERALTRGERGARWSNPLSLGLLMAAQAVISRLVRPGRSRTWDSLSPPPPLRLSLTINKL